MISAVVYDAAPGGFPDADKRLAVVLNTLAAQMSSLGDEVVYCESAAPNYQLSRPEQIWDSLLPLTRRLLRVVRGRASGAVTGRSSTVRQGAAAFARAVAMSRTDSLNRWVMFVDANAMLMGDGTAGLPQIVSRLNNAIYLVPHIDLPANFCAALVRSDPDACFQIARTWVDDLAAQPGTASDSQSLDPEAHGCILVPRRALAQLWAEPGRAAAGAGKMHEPVAVVALAGGYRSLGLGAGRASGDGERQAADALHAEAVICAETAEDIRLDVAPGERVRAVVQRVASLVAGSSAWRPEQQLSLLGGLDAVSAFPRDAAFLYAGSEPALFHAIAYGMALMGFRKRLLVPDSLASRIARDALPHVQVCPDAVALQLADVIVFEAAAIAGVAVSGPIDPVFQALIDGVLRVERGRASLGEGPRPMISVGSDAIRLFDRAEAFEVSELRMGACIAQYAHMDGGDADDGREESSPAVVRLLRRLTRIAPLTSGERFDLATWAGEISVALESVLVRDALYPFDEYAKTTLSEVFNAALSVPGLAPVTSRVKPAVSGMAQSRAWNDPDWASCAARISHVRNSWTWERAQVLYAIRTLVRSDLSGKILVVVAQYEPFIDVLIEELGSVDVIGVDALLDGPREPGLDGILPSGATRVTLEAMASGSYGLVICPHASLFRDGIGGLGDYVASLREFVAPGGYVFVCGETALQGRTGASRPDLAYGGPEGGAAKAFQLAGLSLQHEDAWGCVPEDFALIANTDNAAPDTLGFRQGADVFWPTVWAFRASSQPVGASASDIRAAFSDQLLGEQISRLSLAPGATRDEHGVVSDTLSGHFVFGPYLRLAAGDYSARALLGLAATDVRQTGKRRAVVEVGLGDEIVAQQSLQLTVNHDASEEVNLTFTVPAGAGPCEVRIWSDGDAHVRVTSVVLTRGASGAARQKRRVRRLVDATLPRFGIRS